MHRKRRLVADPAPAGALSKCHLLEEVMEFEQLVKRLEWLDEEHRKTKSSIITVEERMKALEGKIDTVAKQLKPLPKQIADVANTASRLNQFDAIFKKQREDMNKAIEEIEKRNQTREKELTKRHQQDFEPILRVLNDLRQTMDSEFPPIKRDLKARVLEENRLRQEIQELKPPIEAAKRAAEEATIVQHAFDENRKQEAKRVADLQGEIAALRKRIEEAKAKADLNADSWKNIDIRIKELIASEAERKAAQNAFIDQQSLVHFDRERMYKEWKQRFDSITIQTETFDTQVQALEEMLRSAKRAQESYNELNVKLERRISEITEMQRLSEDRLRQEWVTFKADDQKRWIGYTLSQNEGTKDLNRALQKLEERIPPLDESIQTLQDQLHQTADATEQQLQELMNVAHEWLSAYERIMGHGKIAKKVKR
jgi:chromosome segregation ATPase